MTSFDVVFKLLSFRFVYKSIKYRDISGHSVIIRPQCFNKQISKKIFSDHDGCRNYWIFRSVPTIAVAPKGVCGETHAVASEAASPAVLAGKRLMEQLLLVARHRTLMPESRTITRRVRSVEIDFMGGGNLEILSKLLRKYLIQFKRCGFSREGRRWTEQSRTRRSLTRVWQRPAQTLLKPTTNSGLLVRKRAMWVHVFVQRNPLWMYRK